MVRIYLLLLLFFSQERLHVIEQSEHAMHDERALEAKRKGEEVRLLEESAKRRREEDVDDSSMVGHLSQINRSHIFCLIVLIFTLFH